MSNVPGNYATELAEAKALQESGDVPGAIPLYEQLAGKGSTLAMVWLGYIYLKGGGVEADINKALAWYLQAASAGDGDAMGRLGTIYQLGDGVPADLAAARQWYEKAARAGDVDGQYNLGVVLFEAGKIKLAMKWIGKAAERGHAAAIRTRRDRNAYKLLEKKRYPQALPLLDLAASEGSAWAQEIIGWMHIGGHGVQQDYNEAIKHYEAAYSGDRRGAAIYIGRAHLEAKRPELALQWLRKDAHPSSSSLYWQYRVLKQHPGLGNHPRELRELLDEAAKSGHVFAKREIAVQMMKDRTALTARLRGLRDFLCLLPEVFRIVCANPHDERLN